ncbi:hypothetical protein CWC38_06800 [Kocuria tytonicola]|uniref:Uncharacterized protein n=1 Tax=Kocuria tytonicola TaxID=2055946 RepID=A0A3L9LBE3_9MICC|nr:hypothetical protein [Kocuria tytonicola]RLY93762.1 hypothetical protein EAE32_00440 [Kocuria tytonicola]RLZ03245.1 hypothetical protein CWC38_06800 [Kocuria tytonicola]
MTRNRTALCAVSAAWIAVLLAVVLSLALGGPLVPFAVFVVIAAPAVTGFWAVRLHRDRQ